MDTIIRTFIISLMIMAECCETNAQEVQPIVSPPLFGSKHGMFIPAAPVISDSLRWKEEIHA